MSFLGLSWYVGLPGEGSRFSLSGVMPPVCPEGCHKTSPSDVTVVFPETGEGVGRTAESSVS